MPGRRTRIAVAGAVAAGWAAAVIVLNLPVLVAVGAAAALVILYQILVQQMSLASVWSKPATPSGKGRRPLLVSILVLLAVVVLVAGQSALLGNWANDSWTVLLVAVVLSAAYIVTRRLPISLALAAASVLAALALVSPRLSTTVTGDPALAGRVDRLTANGWLGGLRDVAIAEVDTTGGPAVRHVGIGTATPDTPMEIGSISKALTGLVIADAVSRGEMRMDAVLSAYLPAVAGSPAGDVTIRDLVTHHGGLAEFGAAALRKAAVRAPVGMNFLHGDVRELVRGLRSDRLSTRGDYVYSSLGSAAAGQALAAATALSYPDLMQRRLFGPLGMTATHVQTVPSVARGWTASGLPAQPWPMDAYAPAGAVVSTTHDLALLAVALLNGTAPGMAALTATDPTQLDYDRIGVFWHISHWMNGQNITWHAGETGGYTAYFALDREHHRAVMVLSDVAAPATQDVGIDLLALPVPAAPR